MTSYSLATLSNFNKLNMCGIQNPRTARDASATNDLRITSGGCFLLVTVMRYYTRGSHKRGIKIVDPGSPFQNFADLFHKSLYQVVSKHYDVTRYNEYILMNLICEKLFVNYRHAILPLSHPV